MGKISHDTASCPASINASRTLPEYSHATRIFMSHPILGLDGPSVKLDGFHDNLSCIVAIAQETIFTLLSGAVLFFEFVFIVHIVEHAIKVFRWIVNNLVDLRVGPNQDQVTGLFTIGKHAGYNVLAFSPKRDIAMRVMFCNPTDIFKVRRIDQFTMRVDPKECV